MTNLANKANLDTALMNAMQPGLNTHREVDKVVARLRKGEFDIEEQVPELVVHAQSILDDIAPHDKKTVEACRYIVKRWEHTKGRRDPVTVGTRSDLDGLEPTDLLNATKFEAWAALDDLAFNRTLGEVLQAAINAGLGHSQIVTNWMVVYESLDVETTGGSVQAVGSPSADYLAYNAGSVAAAIGSMELIKARMIAVDLADNADER